MAIHADHANHSLRGEAPCAWISKPICLLRNTLEQTFSCSGFAGPGPRPEKACPFHRWNGRRGRAVPRVLVIGGRKRNIRRHGNETSQVPADRIPDQPYYRAEAGGGGFGGLPLIHSSSPRAEGGFSQGDSKDGAEHGVADWQYADDAPYSHFLPRTIVRRISSGSSRFKLGLRQNWQTSGAGPSIHPPGVPGRGIDRLCEIRTRQSQTPSV
jgi:hypothetical protein